MDVIGFHFLLFVLGTNKHGDGHEIVDLHLQQVRHGRANRVPLVRLAPRCPPISTVPSGFPRSRLAEFGLGVVTVGVQRLSVDNNQTGSRNEKRESAR